jgi:hypothetical protein
LRRTLDSFDRGAQRPGFFFGSSCILCPCVPWFQPRSNGQEGVMCRNMTLSRLFFQYISCNIFLNFPNVLITFLLISPNSAKTSNPASHCVILVCQQKETVLSYHFPSESKNKKSFHFFVLFLAHMLLVQFRITKFRYKNLKIDSLPHLKFPLLNFPSHTLTKRS